MFFFIKAKCLESKFFSQLKPKFHDYKLILILIKCNTRMSSYILIPLFKHDF